MRSESRMVDVAGVVLIILAVAACCATWAEAQVSPVWDLGRRTQVAVDVGAMKFASEDAGGAEWGGITAGGSITYSLHERFSLVGRYDHGFPVAVGDGHENVIRAKANLKVYPLVGETSDNQLFVGAGRMWFGEGGETAGWQGWSAEMTVSRIFRDGWALFGTYAHGFDAKDAASSVNVGKIGLQHRLFGAR